MNYNRSMAKSHQEITHITRHMVSKSSRERIIDAAIGLISKRGYSETTVGDIEHQAGLTRRAGGFYRHFISKEDVLVQALRKMASNMVAEILLKEIVSLKSTRAELLVIARALMRHAELYRPLRLILQREGHKLPALRAAARLANARLASLDVLPWIKHALRRSAVNKPNPRELGLLIFGPILLYIVSIDRGDPAFGVRAEGFLDTWADHWTEWLERGGK
jgi:AcrR family transcriptional regulator